MALTVDQTLREIEQLHRDKPVFEHPLYQEIVEGTLSKEQLKEEVRQNGIIPLYNHNYHGRLYVICPDPKWREMIAEVAYEEGTGRLHANGVAHYELYLRLGESLGITREEMWDTRYCAGALALRAYFSEICGRNFLEGVATHMLAAESPVPVYGSRRSDALRKHYGLTDEDVLFFTVHITADEDHTNIGKDILSQFAKTEDDLQLVLRTVENYLDLRKLANDDIYNRVKSIK